MQDGAPVSADVVAPDDVPATSLAAACPGNVRAHRDLSIGYARLLGDASLDEDAADFVVGFGGHRWRVETNGSACEAGIGTLTENVLNVEVASGAASDLALDVTCVAPNGFLGDSPQASAAVEVLVRSWQPAASPLPYIYDQPQSFTLLTSRSPEACSVDVDTNGDGAHDSVNPAAPTVGPLGQDRDVKIRCIIEGKEAVATTRARVALTYLTDFETTVDAQFNGTTRIPVAGAVSCVELSAGFPAVALDISGDIPMATLAWSCPETRRFGTLAIASYRCSASDGATLDDFFKITCGSALDDEDVLAVGGMDIDILVGDINLTGTQFSRTIDDLKSMTGRILMNQSTVTPNPHPDITFPLLHHVGDIRMADIGGGGSVLLGSFRAPRLARIDNLEMTDVRIEGLELPRLEDVSGNLILDGNTFLSTIDLSSLRRVGSTLRISDVGTQLDCDALTDVVCALDQMPQSIELSHDGTDPCFAGLVPTCS